MRGEPAPVTQQVVQQVVQQPAATQGTSAPAQPATSAAGAQPVQAAATAQTATQAEPAPLDASAVKKLQASWNPFLATIRGRCGHEVQAALRTVRDVAVSDNSVAFAFGNNDFTRKMVEKPDTLKAVAATLSEVLGRSVHLECQLGEKAQLHNVIGVTRSDEDDEGPIRW